MTDQRAELVKLGQRRQKLQTELDQLRPELAEAIRRAAEAGVRQVDIVKVTGYTREMVRRIVGSVADPSVHPEPEPRRLAS